MTVCIAVLCHVGTVQMIITASDRMLTYGDVEYEPDTSKIWALDEGAKHLALVSGEMAQQRLIATRATERIRALDNPTVEEAAEIYAQEFGMFRREKNEAEFLAPLGLNMETLMRPGRVEPQLAESLMARMTGTNLDDEVIVVGVNPDGRKHIYVICDPGRAILMDTPGWAAIGSGRGHVDSEFTVERYQAGWGVEQALLLMYTAKKRAEAAPGVGNRTDLTVINDNGWAWLRDTIVDGVAGAHDELARSEREVRESSLQKMNEIVSKAIAEPRAEAPQIGPPGEEPTPSGEGTDSSDEGGI